MARELKRNNDTEFSSSFHPCILHESNLYTQQVTQYKTTLKHTKFLTTLVNYVLYVLKGGYIGDLVAKRPFLRPIL
jgi:hypothetical protein